MDTFKSYSEKAGKGHRLLKRINLNIFNNKKVCITGNVSSGKSSLLMALAGELKLGKGLMGIKGSVGYVNLSERVFFNGTLRENIIMDQEYKVARYNNVIQTVGLDLSMYLAKDLTEVLENGSNFSEVDRQRIVMARSLYMDKDIYLIDDYFDKFEIVSTMSHFDSVVQGFLSSRLVLYVSNENMLAKNSDLILVMEGGSIKEHGKYSELYRDKRSLFRKIITSNNARLEDGPSTIAKLVQGFDMSKRMKEKLWLKNTFHLVSQLFIHRYKQLKSLETYNPKTMDRNHHDFSKLFFYAARLYSKKVQGKITSDEKLPAKYTPIRMILKFMTINGLFYFFTIVCLFLLSVSLYIGNDIWIGLWSTNELHLASLEYFFVYALISGSICVLLVVRDLYYNSRMITNSNTLHFKTIHRIILAKQSWIQKTPTSRIIYRLTKDQQ